MINVIKVGGGIIEDQSSLSEFLKSFAQLKGKKILIHGGGRLATTLAKKLGIESKMIEGRRVTDDATLEIVTMVYGGLANKTIVAGLQALGVNALGLTGADGNAIQAHKRTGWEHDFGWVGDVDKVNGELLLSLLNQGLIPVIAPLSHDGQGHILNTNADTIASEVAKAMSTMEDTQLILGFELDGVMKNPKDASTLITKITKQDFENYKADGTITDGMIPKLDNAFKAIGSGVKAVRICNAMKVGDEKSGTLIQ
ncbi:MAG: acetylglutamate kinase [Bacteroidetes bacterium]|nr:acetylglutamate kinase [Bacteroidota bacterium]